VGVGGLFDLVAPAVSVAPARPVAGVDGGLAGRLAGRPRADRLGVLVGLVRGEVAGVLGHGAAGSVGVRRPFRELGFDSLAAVELRDRLSRACGVGLSTTVVFDHPSVWELAEFLATELGDGPDPETDTRTSARVGVGVDGGDPVVIVGMGCRFPGGAVSPDDLWTLVAEGRDAVGDFPADRGWDVGFLGGMGERATFARVGGFVAGAAGFDAGFFGISPREALALDPQQRVLLEVCWEVFESAGIDVEALRGSSTGVFMGTNAQDYATLLLGAGAQVEGYQATGNGASVVSGRVAYTFGLQGPAVTVDTACSSSLVGLHLAVQALRSGECDLALAGGVTVMSTPGVFLEFARQGGLAADGRCKPFAAAADGTGWGEGAGVLLLERRSDARRLGHEVLAVVVGSAVNQDGASNGLTAPNGPAQQRVIRQALANAGLTTADVDVVEAHGTGTRLGDPIEAQALIATYGQGRDPGQEPVWIGSVKSNIGHTQAAAGVAGVIKMVMAMRHGLVPENLHVDEPTGQVDWSAGTVAVNAQPRPWPQTLGRPRRAGVSSFGISGTNAHTIIEAPPVAPEPAPATPALDDDPAGRPPAIGPAAPPLGGVWVISGSDPAGLRARAAQLADWAEDTQVDGIDGGVSVADVGWELALRRSQLGVRAVVTGPDRAALVAGLRAVAAGGAPGLSLQGPDSGSVDGVVFDPGVRAGVRGVGGVVWMFSGQGAQRVGMGRELYRRFPVFAGVVDEACEILDPLLPRPLRPVMFADAGSEPEGLLTETVFAQAGLFVVEVAVAALLRSWDVPVGWVVGHSVGEIAAACVAGVLSLRDGCRLVAARGRLMQALPPGGVMLAVGCDEATARDLLDSESTTGVSIAAVNGPGSVVLSGAAEQLAAIREVCVRRELRTSALRVSHAFHSPLMDPILRPFAEELDQVEWGRATIPLVSTVTGQIVPDEVIGTAEYWVRHARDTVRFADAITHLLDRGADTFVEIGPDAVLTAMLPDLVPGGAGDGDTGVVGVAVMRAARGDHVATTIEAIARLHTHGVPIGWQRILTPGRHVAHLPTYPFQHQRFWPTITERSGDGADDRLWELLEHQPAELAGSGIDTDLPLREVLPALTRWRRRQHAQSRTGQWRYQITWTPVPAPPAGEVDATGHRWLLVHTPAITPIAERLAGAFDRHHCATHLSPATPGTLAGELSTAITQFQPTAVISLLALDTTAHPDHPHLTAGLAANLTLIQTLTTGDPTTGAPAPPGFWLCTQTAVQTGPADAPPDPDQATTWGLGQVTALEHPHQYRGLIDLPKTLELTPATLTDVVRTLTGTQEQTAIRSAGSLTRRLTRVRTTPATHNYTLRNTALITGATGSLAGHTTQWLVQQGAKRLILVSRQGPQAPGATELVDRLTAAGATVQIVACDVTDRESVAALADQLRRDGETISTIVHAAGVARLTPVAEVSIAELADVTAAKIAGARNLSDLIDRDHLESVVFFSSIAGVWGVGRHGAYAAGNAFLDAWAQTLRTEGVPALSVAWGPWGGGGGMVNQAIGAEMNRHGVRLLDPDAAISVLHDAMEHDESTHVVADVDWPRFAPIYSSARPRPLIGLIPEVVDADPAMSASDPDSDAAIALRQRLGELPEADQNRLLVELVQATAAQVLGHQRADDLERTRPFREVGFDSLTAVELRARLVTATGLRLATTIVFDHPTPVALAEYLRTELAGDVAESVLPTVTELDLLEETLAARPQDDLGRVRVTLRLQSLLRRLTSDEPVDPGGDAATTLRVASNEELFDLVDHALGLS
jgi:acyl transferase domain-containing protein/acyl carrier protein